MKHELMILWFGDLYYFYPGESDETNLMNII